MKWFEKRMWADTKPEFWQWDHKNISRVHDFPNPVTARSITLQTSYISPQGEFWKLAGGILILFQKLIKLCQTEHPQPKKKKCAKLSKNHWRMFCWVFILRAFKARWAFDGPDPGLTQKHIGPTSKGCSGKAHDLQCWPNVLLGEARIRPV